MDLHAKDIQNFGQIKQGALIAQRALDASTALDRLETGNFDAAKGSQRGFKLWGDESPELADIVNLCESLNTLEEQGVSTVPANAASRIESALDHAASTFHDAGYPALAANIHTIKTYILGTAATPQAAATNRTQDGDDPAPSP